MTTPSSSSVPQPHSSSPDSSPTPVPSSTRDFWLKATKGRANREDILRFIGEIRQNGGSGYLEMAKRMIAAGCGIDEPINHKKWEGILIAALHTESNEEEKQRARLLLGSLCEKFELLAPHQNGGGLVSISCKKTDLGFVGPYSIVLGGHTFSTKTVKTGSAIHWQSFELPIPYPVTVPPPSRISQRALSEANATRVAAVTGKCQAVVEDVKRRSGRGKDTPQGQDLDFTGNSKSSKPPAPLHSTAAQLEAEAFNRKAGIHGDGQGM